MTSIIDGSVKIQTTPESNFSTPSWFGEPNHEGGEGTDSAEVWTITDPSA